MAGLGYVGTQILVAHLVLVASVTVMLRLATYAATPRPGRVGSPTERPLRRPGLRDPQVVWPLAATGSFFVLWNVAATTLGSYGTYFLVTHTGLTQRQATALVLLAFPPALLLATAYSRLADSPWRDRLFLVAMPLQIAAFTLGAVTAGTTLWSMVGLVVLYGLSNVFAGEAAWKVWAQQLFPAEVRATALGLTYGLARAVAACFLFLVPAVIDTRPAAVLWTLVGCVTLSGTVGLVIVFHPRLLGKRHTSTTITAPPDATIEP